MKCFKTFFNALLFAGLAAMMLVLTANTVSAGELASARFGQMDWYINGINRGLYANPELDYSITHHFQNETISDIIRMSKSVSGFDINEFFEGTIFAGYTVSDLEDFYAMQIDDMSELTTYILGANEPQYQEGVLGMDTSSVLIAYPDSTFNYFKIPAYNTAHGALFRLSIGGRNGLCINYGRNAPSGANYYQTNFSDYASASQMETIKIGVLFSLYYHNIDIGNGSAYLNFRPMEDIPMGDWTYLMAQVWCWCAMLDMSPLECAQQFALVLMDWGGNNKNWADSIMYEANLFLNNRYYEYYELDTTLYTSNNPADQIIFVYDYNSITPYLEIDPAISTSVINKATKMTQSMADEMVRIVDTVYYENLITGKNYDVYGLLMVREDGMPLTKNGTTITSTSTLIPSSPTGSINMEFEFDSAGLAGKTVVVFEAILYEGKTVISHEDINDEAQSIHFPAISTFAYDKNTGIKNTNAAAGACIVDKISYTNLIAGEQYKLVGALMDKSTGEALLADGKAVTAERNFSANSANGSIDMSYSFNAEGLMGKTIVVYEELYYRNKLIGRHTDITDTAQTIYIPGIATIALDKDTGSHHALAGSAVSITDNVFYQNLTPGLNYRVVGSITDRDSGEAIIYEGTPLISTTHFTPAQASGSVLVEYEVPAQLAEGRELAIFEDIYYGDTLVASHGDIDNLAQVITVDGGLSTGDESMMAVWIGVTSFTVSAAGGVVYIMKRKEA